MHSGGGAAYSHNRKSYEIEEYPGSASDGKRKDQSVQQHMRMRKQFTADWLQEH
jgi:hypothetical protein